MMVLFRVRVVGDGDVLVDGVPLESDSRYFRSPVSKNVKVFLEHYLGADIKPLYGHTYAPRLLKDSLRDMLQFIKAKEWEHNEYSETYDGGSIFRQEFGGNQYVSIERVYVPEDAEIED